MRRRREPLWPRIAAIAVAVIVAALLVNLVARGLIAALGIAHPRGAAGRDPQFAEPAETVTRPPELDENGDPIDIGDDPSLGWTYEAQTPVDKTAGELALEAEASD